MRAYRGICYILIVESKENPHVREKKEEGRGGSRIRPAWTPGILADRRATLAVPAHTSEITSPCPPALMSEISGSLKENTGSPHISSLSSGLCLLWDGSALLERELKSLRHNRQLPAKQPSPEQDAEMSCVTRGICELPLHAVKGHLWQPLG